MRISNSIDFHKLRASPDAATATLANVIMRGGRARIRGCGSDFPIIGSGWRGSRDIACKIPSDVSDFLAAGVFGEKKF